MISRREPNHSLAVERSSSEESSSSIASAIAMSSSSTASSNPFCLLQLRFIHFFFKRFHFSFLLHHSWSFFFIFFFILLCKGFSLSSFFFLLLCHCSNNKIESFLIKIFKFSNGLISSSPSRPASVKRQLFFECSSFFDFSNLSDCFFFSNFRSLLKLPQVL